MEKTLTGSIALTKLTHARVKTKKGADCLMIPIDSNLLEKDEKGNVYITVRIIYKSEQDQYKQNGFIGKSIPSKIYKSATEEQKKEWTEKRNEFTPILGNIKDWSSQSDTPNTSTDVGEPENDDLPF